MTQLLAAASQEGKADRGSDFGPNFRDEASATREKVGHKKDQRMLARLETVTSYPRLKSAGNVKSVVKLAS